MNDIPRRCRLDLNTPAEHAIYDAMIEVEKLAADVRLTDAVILLGEARNAVADFVDDADRTKRRIIRFTGDTPEPAAPSVSDAGLDLEPIEQREQQATAGPWQNGVNRDSQVLRDDHMGQVVAMRQQGTQRIGLGICRTWHPDHIVSYVGLSRQETIANAEFIAHARQDIPALVVEVKRLRARLAAVEGAKE